MKRQTGAPEKTAEPNYRIYIAVWAALLCFTVLTVAAAALGPAAGAVVICLAIAAATAGLVFLFFMHLRWEKRLLVRLLVPITLAVLAIFIGLTFSDVLTR